MNPGKRPLMLALGLAFVAIGAVGAFLPVLPTTPFLIVALWFFARSSERLHNWLYYHRLFGPPLQVWDQYRVIPPVAKIASTGSMLASLAYLLFFSDPPLYIIFTMIVLVIWGMWYVLSKPSYPPVTEEIAEPEI